MGLLAGQKPNAVKTVYFTLFCRFAGSFAGDEDQ
jgi:hypothetical protein